MSRTNNEHWRKVNNCGKSPIGPASLVVGSPYDPFWRSKHTTVASSNGSDITCKSTIFLTSIHHTKSSSSGRTRASISGPLFAVYSRSTTCRGRLKYPPPTFLTTAFSAPTSTCLALPIKGPLSTSSPVRDRVDNHAAKLFFWSAPTSPNRSRKRTTQTRLAFNPSTLPLNRVPHQATNRKTLPSL